MTPKRTPSRPLLRLPLLLVTLAAAIVGTLSAPRVDARQQWLRGQTVTRGSKPFTESVAQMRRRDLIRRTRFLGANLSPAPRANPRHPKPPPSPTTSDLSVQGLFLPNSAPTVQGLGSTFAGIGMQQQIKDLFGWSFPPDTMGAVGPNHFVQVINGSVAIFNKNTGNRLSHISLDSFFTFTANSVTYPRNGAFDPRVIYDPHSRRWFVCALEFGAPTPSGFTAENQLLLAVSRTSDPTGSFDKYVLPIAEPTTGSTAGFTDYPTLGVDRNGLYVAVRIFPFNPVTGLSAPFSFAKLVATPLSPLVAGAPSLGPVTVLSDILDMFSTPQPATNLDAIDSSTPAWFFASSPSNQHLQYRKVSWNGEVPSFSDTATLGGIPAATLSLPEAPAQGSSTRIHTGDFRLQSATILNGRLWTARTVAVNSAGAASPADRTACEWFELDVSGATPSLVQVGRVFDTTPNDPTYYYYPAIMVNGQGHAVMGFSGSRSTGYVGAYYTGRLAGDPLGTMGAPVLYKAGAAGYIQNDPSGRNRWGDYSHTTLDPNDWMSLWTVQEYAEAKGSSVSGVTSRWGTRVARILAPAPTLVSGPTVTVERGATGVTLSLTGTGFFDPGPGFPNRLSAEITGGSPNGITITDVTYLGPTAATVTFDVAPNAAGGSRTLTLTNPDGQRVSVPHAVAVLSEEEPSRGKLAASPKKLKFGKVKVGKSKRKKLKLKNKGKGVLQGEVGAIDARFTILSGGGPFELQPRKGLTVRVEYAPTVKETIDTTLEITSTDSRKPFTSVKIKAAGK